MHEDDVAEVDVGLPRIQRFLTHLVEADHRLQLGAVSILKCREAQFSGVASEHHPSRDTDHVVGRGVGGQVRVGRANLGQRVRPLNRHRVRVVTLCQQPGALVPPDPELLGKIP